jgi:MoaA/NifB/PqqE/SkfB family radical SAM enzyme
VSRYIVFHVTERCSLSCRHCLRDPGKKPVDLSLDVVEKVLTEASALHGIHHAGLTGGDPLLWPHIEGALDAMVRHGYTWHLVTSGRGFERLVDLLEGVPARRDSLSVIDFSLDGASEAIHDRLRGHGSHREVMSAVAACRSRGYPFALQMTVNALNQADVEKVALAAADLGATQVSFAMTNASGSAEDRALYLVPSALDGIRDRVDRLESLLRLKVVVAEGFRRGPRFHVCEAFQSKMLHVTPQGQLNLCCNHSGIPGGDEDVVADVLADGLAEGHRRLLDLIYRMERERLDAIEGQPGSELGWDDFPCNWCLAHLGKPHWVEGGSAGPRASRITG